jgi:dUTP pyrophosphatase
MVKTLRILFIKDTGHEFSEEQQMALCQAVKRPEITYQTTSQDAFPDMYIEPRDAGIDMVMPMAHVCPPGLTTTLPLGVAVAAYETTMRDDHRGNSWSPCSMFLIVRSSTGTKTPLRQANAPGLIDAGYRGTLVAAVDNISAEPFTAREGARYFQLMACDGVPFDEVRIVDQLPTSARGEGGFGSTGE